MINKRFNKAKMVISSLLRRIPIIYINNILNYVISNTVYDGDDNSVCNYLELLYDSIYSNQVIEENLSNSELKVNEKELINFGNFITNNIDNICYNASISNYSNPIEANISLRKNDLILKKFELKLLFQCFTDLNENLKIRKNLFDKINKCYFYTKYKGNNSVSCLNNFRFISNHHKIFKILDKILMTDILNELRNKNKMPDSNIYCSNLDKSYNVSIRELSYSVTKSNDNIILIDISKAFDNIEWCFVESMLMESLSKKIGKEKANNFTKKYMFLLKNRRMFYKENSVNVKKGLSTGLFSSNIIFTLLFEEVISEYIYYLKTMNIKLDVDYIIKIFVDDICIKILNEEKKNTIFNNIISILKFNGYKINMNKCKASSNLSLKITEIKDGDYYLGLPFSSSVKTYLDACLKQLNQRHINIDYKNIKRIIKLNRIFKHNNNLKKIYNKIIGFFQYKLYGLNKYNIKIHLHDTSTKLLEFIDKYYS